MARLPSARWEPWADPWVGWAAAALLLLLAQRYLKLIERLVSVLLSLRLVSVFNSLGPETIHFSLWRGSFSIQNVHIKPEFVDSLDLPFRCKKAVIKKLELHMPVLRYGGSRPAVLHVSSIEVEATTRRTPKVQSADAFDEAAAKAAAKQRAARLGVVEALLWGGAPVAPRKFRPRRALRRLLALQAARLLEVRLHDVALHVTVDRPLDVGAPPLGRGGSPEADSVLGARVSFRLHGLALSSAPGEGRGAGALVTELQLRGLSVEVAQPPGARGPGKPFGVVRRWNADVRLGWRLAAPFLQRVAHGGATLLLSVRVFAHALLLRLDPPACRAMLALHAHALHFLRYHQFRQLRPQVPVAERPQAWWQHAGRAVLRQRAAALGPEAAPGGLAARRQRRRAYEALYLRRRSGLAWLVDCLRGCPGAAAQALALAEARLSDGEIAQFRWWAWARRRRRREVDAAGVLEEVYRVVGARGKLKLSRPLRARLHVECPKASLLLEGGSGEAGAFEIATHQLACSLQAGSPHPGQLQSGAGPLSLDASIAAFHISHECAAGAGPSSACSEALPWLVKSPPEPAGKELAPDFLTLKCSRPALQASDPMQVQLSVAQTDMLYSQQALLRLVAFLDEGYPPPALDPLMVRASITLAEIVRERLLQPRAQLTAAKRQQAQLRLDVAAGDVRMIMPCSEAAAAGRAAAVQGRPAAALDETGATVVEGPEPGFLVVILSDFRVSTQAGEAAEPRLTRQTTDVRAETHHGGGEGAAEAGPAGRLRRTLSRPPGEEEQAAREWLRASPDASAFEKLQVSVGLEAFLAKPDAGPLDFRDCAQVIDPFAVTARVDHSVQAASAASYRRVLLVRMSTTPIQLELSRGVKQELHSLAAYMHSNLTDRSVTQTFNRHFTGKAGGPDGLETRRSMEAGALRRSGAAAGQVVFAERRSAFRRVATETTEFSGGQSRADGPGSAATDGGGEGGTQEAGPEASYGLVLALRVHLPALGLNLLQSAGAEDGGGGHPGLPAGVFTLTLADVHTSLAVDGGVTDGRFAVGSVGLEDAAPGAAQPCIIRPMRPALHVLAGGPRGMLRRALQEWRRIAAAQARGLRARRAPELWAYPQAAQLYGRLVSRPGSLDAGLESSTLQVAAEVDSLRRALLCACELAEAQPAACKAHGGACEVGVTVPPSAFLCAAAEQPPAPGRALSLNVHLQLLRAEVVVEGRRLATVSCSGLDCSWRAAAPPEVYLQLQLSCDSLQVLDRLAASRLHQEVLCCERPDGGEAGGGGGEPEPPLQLAVALQPAYHEPPASLAGGLEGEDGAAPQATTTAAQRLAALGPGAGLSDSQRRRKASRRKKKAQAQRLVRAEVRGLHATLVHRFLLDCSHFGSEVAAMLSAVAGSSPGCQAPAAPPPPCYRTITEVCVSDVRLDVPRHSWAPEFYSLAIPHASFAYPATQAYANCLRPDMHRAPRPGEFRRAGFETVEGEEWGEVVARVLASQAGHGDSERSSLPAAFYGSQEHNDKFHHWQTGQDGGLAAQLEQPRLFWCLAQAGGGISVRQVWDGGDVALSLRPETREATFWCPWVSCVFGALQYELLLAALWENAAEPGSFGRPPEPLIPVGRPLPPAPPHARLPGVDKGRPPVWAVRVELGHVLLKGEALPPPSAAVPGRGPPLGQVRLRDAAVCVGEWPCGAWDVTLQAAAAQLSDAREGGPLLHVLRVGDIEEGTRRTLDSTGRASAPPSPAHRWAKLREAVWDAAGPFARLARGTPGGELPAGADAPFLTELGKGASGEGFFLEYVLTATAPATPDHPALPGPHVAEAVLRGGRLTLPVASLRSFGHDVQATYSHYLYPHGPSPHPQVPSPDEWMFVNLVARDCEMWVPLPGSAPAHAAVVGGGDGLTLAWRSLRAGYCWGGDGECVTWLDAERLGATGHVADAPPAQALVLPFSAHAELKQHTPKDAGEGTSVGLDLRASRLEATPAFGQIPLFHAAARMATANLVSPTAPAAAPAFAPFRPSSQRAAVRLESVVLGLTDDRYGHRIRVLTGQLKDVEVSGGRDCSHAAAPPSTHVMAAASLEVLFLNSAIDATEPMLEQWPFGLSFREANGGRTAGLTSGARLNLVATPAAFRSVGDLLAFASAVAAPPHTVAAATAAAGARGLPGGLVRGLRRAALGAPRKQGATLYRIANQSGLKLSYWVSREGGDAHLLRPFQTAELGCEPLAKSVIMPDSQQPVQVRTICMQFEGNWAPVTDIVVDKVGKYAYSIGSQHESAITPVVMDVALDIRTKVLTVHSPFRIENHTNHPLEFNVHLFPTPAARPADSSSALGSRLAGGNAAISTVPAAPLQPGAQCYLPVPAVWGGLMYLHAVGWQPGKKDKIDLEGPKLREKEGLYTCPPALPGQKPFHCCLKVREELIKVFSEEGISSSAAPEYVLCFQPPLVLHNCLPHPLTVTLADSATPAGEGATFTIAVGGFVEVYQFDMARKIRMSVQMREWHSLHSVNVHYPPSAYMADATRKTVVADLPGLRLAKQLPLGRAPHEPPPGAGGPLFGPQANRLSLRLHNKMDPGSRAREVVVSCPYWIVNKTNLVLSLQDKALNASPQPILAPPGLGRQAEPVLFSSSRGSMRVAVVQGAWSWAINLESLGLHAAFHVLGPPQAGGAGGLPGRRPGSGDEGIVHFDCEKVVQPRNYSPRRNKLVTRLGSVTRMDSTGDLGDPPSPGPAEVTDPGHVTRAFACATGGGDAAAADGDRERVKRFEFALETGVGPSIFHHTKVITITPRYVLLNTSSEPLQCGQRGTTLVWQLAPGVRAPFHWDDADGRFELCVRPAAGKWNWSGAFQIANVGDFGLRVFNPTTQKHLILPVEVSLTGAAFLVAVGREAEQPPYRIENRCESVKIRFQQRDIDRERWEEVEPGHSVDYAWEEPTAAHKLCVMLETEGGAFRDASEHDYNLDVIKAFPVVKLRRTNVKIVHKVANTVGRVMTAGVASVSSKGGGGGGGAAAGSRDQPELDARYVYVGVHADGPTRVLCFSESRDEYTRGTSEESLALLHQKLKALGVRNREVDEQLRRIDEQQNIDMSLVMGAPTQRAEPPDTRDQAPLPERPSMRLGRMRTLSADLAAVGSLGSVAHGSASLGTTGVRRSDPSGRSPRTEGTEDGGASGPPTLVRRSLAIIRKVAFPAKEAAAAAPAAAAGGSSERGHDLASIREREHEGSPRSLAADSVLSGPEAAPQHASPFRAEPPHGSGGASSEPEPPQTFAAFNQRSTAAQRALSRFGRGAPTGSQASPVAVAMAEAEAGPSGSSSHVEEIQPQAALIEESPRGSLAAAAKLRAGLAGKLSIKIPEVGGEELCRVASSPYDPALTPSSSSGSSTFARLRKLSIMRQPASKPRTIGSTADMDALLAGGGLPRGALDRALSSPAAGSGEGGPGSEDGTRILGGELVVRVLDAQGLTASWRKKEERQASKAGSRAQQLRLRASSGRGDVYCTLSCEGQVRRTALARGHLSPVWREDVAFKSVQISSDLQVSVYGHSRLGSDVFLGEVVIPLREVEGTADSGEPPDVRRYVLGRRSAKEKVSGEISLACCWRVTPLDVATMKVKQQQAEVDRKEEILALLLERYGLPERPPPPPPPRPPLSPAGGAGAGASAAMHSLKSLGMLPDQDPELRRLAATRGRLSIKVMEGRNIRPQHEGQHGFHAIDGYVQVTVHGEAGDVSRATKAERGSLAPVWNKALAWGDVALGASVTVSLLDHKKLSADVLVGQAPLPLLRFRSGKPHYLWLPVHRRQGGQEPVTGELRLRVQWASDSVREPEARGPSWALEVQLKGVGLSVIEAVVLKVPREAMHALFEDIHLDFKLSAAEQAGSFSIASMQIDNQLLTSTHPVVLSHDARQSQVGEEGEGGLPRPHGRPPLLEVRWDMQQHNASINYVKGVSFTLQPVDLVLEEEFLELLLHLAHSLPAADIWQTRGGGAGEEPDQEAEIAQSLQEVLDASMSRGAGGQRAGKKWYFEHLDIHGIRCNLTLVPRQRGAPAAGEPGAGALGRPRLSAAFGVRFMDIHSVPLRINALQMRNAFVTWRTLVSQIYRHLFFQALYEVHKILGQVDILGTPFVLGSNLVAGLASFFKEPLKARTPRQFARGMAKGSAALVKFSAFGFLEALGQLTGGVSKGLAMLTMDQEYVNRFRVRPTTLRTRLMQGVQAAGIGAYEGVIGVLREPINGWEADALRGALVGVYLGSAGLLLKPLSGLLELLSRSISGAGEAIRALGDEVTRVPKTRVRSPRQFMPTGVATGELYSASWKANLMARLRKGRFAADELLDYLQNKDNKALLFTDRHLIYIELQRQRVRWSFSIEHLTSVTTSGLLVLLHHDLTVRSPLPGRGWVRFPVRKRVRCRTRDLHQSLLVKLANAQQQPRPAEPAAAAEPTPTPRPPRVEEVPAGGSPRSHRTSPGSTPSAKLPALTRVLSSLRPARGVAEQGPSVGAARPVQAVQAVAASGSSTPLDRRRPPSPSRRARPQEHEQALACLRAVRLLATAAGRPEAEPALALQHLRSIALLCHACLSGAGGEQLDAAAKAALASLHDLCLGASEAGLATDGHALFATLGLLCAAAEGALAA